MTVFFPPNGFSFAALENFATRAEGRTPTTYQPGATLRRSALPRAETVRAFQGESHPHTATACSSAQRGETGQPGAEHSGVAAWSRLQTGVTAFT